MRKPGRKAIRPPGWRFLCLLIYSRPSQNFLQTYKFSASEVLEILIFCEEAARDTADRKSFAE
jgi:hypothetical protein